MELKTKITAEPDKQDLVMTREFDLPLELLFKACSEAEIIEQWMGTRVLKFEGRKHGSWQFETTDGKGKVLFRANGVIHDFVPNEKITRTFEMENAPFDAQLEFTKFEKLTDDKSKMTVHTIFKTAAQRDQMMQYGMEKGANMAHNRLQDVVGRMK